MAKKSASRPESSALLAAVEEGNLEAVQSLLRAGQKPTHDAAEAAAGACNKAFARSRPSAKTSLFHKKLSQKEQTQAAADAEKFRKVVEALLGAGAPAPESELCPAARNGNTRLALLLIKAGADVDYDPPMGTPLENAVEAGDLEVIRALIQAGADIHHRGVKGTLLERAVSVSQRGAAEELIKAGVNPDAGSPRASTPLLTAVTERRLEFVRKLLGAGANVNQKGTTICGDFGEPEVRVEGMLRTTHIPNPPFAHDSTPLIVATRRGYTDVARILIEAGADLESKDKEGWTALAYATKAGNQEIIQVLLQSGARALEHAEGSAEAAFMAAARKGEISRLQALLSEGLGVNVKYSTDEEAERTALICATENGQADAVRFLLKSGAKVDEPCGKGWDEAHQRTALMHAAQAGREEIIQILLKAGANISAKDGGMEDGGRMPLHYAAEAGQAGAIRVLVQTGAKVNAKTKGGETPLILAAGEGHLSAMQALIELGADPNLGTKDGLTPLYAAASKGAGSAVSLLLTAGARITVDKRGLFSPMEAAASGGFQDVVELLLQAQAPTAASGGAVLDPKALANAALMGQEGVVRMLLKAGAKVNEADEEGFTPLMAAVRSGNLNIVKAILAAHAEVNAVNEQCETALDMAYDNIKAAKDQAKFLKLMSRGEMDDETRDALKLIKGLGNEDEITRVLKEAGGKRGKDLKLPKAKPPVVVEAEPEPELPDFTSAAAAPAYKAAVQEVGRICGDKPKPLSNEDGDGLAGCVFFRVPTEKLDEILASHQEVLLRKGCFLVRQERGYSSGKDHLTALPTQDWRMVLRAFQTNGANCDIFTEDIIKWLEELETEQPFVLTGAGFDWCEGKFTTPLKNPRKRADRMYEFCPDIVDQGTGEVSRLASELKKKRAFFFWWD